MNAAISVKEILLTSLHILLTNKWYIFKTLLVVFLVVLPISLVPFGGLLLIRFLFGENDVVGNIIFIVVVFAAIILIVPNIQIGIMRAFLGLVDGRRMPVKSLFTNIKTILPYIVASFLQGAVILVGFLLFIVPGIYFLVRYAFVHLAVIDPASNMQGREPLYYSWNLTRKRFIKSSMVLIASSGIPLIIGYFLSLLIGVITRIDFIPIIIRFLLVALVGIVVILLHIYSGVFTQLVVMVAYRRFQSAGIVPVALPTPTSAQASPQPETQVTQS